MSNPAYTSGKLLNASTREDRVWFQASATPLNPQGAPQYGDEVRQYFRN